MAHSLGGHFDMQHGVVHPILLPSFMRFNLPFNTRKMAELGRVILKRELACDEATAHAGIARLDSFFASFNVPLRLREIVPEQQEATMENICRMAVQDACNLTNAKPATWQEFLQILEEVW